LRRAVRLAVAVITVAGVLFLFGFPVRTWLQQQHQMSADQRRVAALKAENAKLSARIAQLHNTAQIERIARSQYGLVLPGQHAYVVVPASARLPAP
jgi:cell division protein FtsB